MLDHINFLVIPIPSGNYNRNTRARCEICSKLTKTPERHHWCFIVNFEQVNAGWDTNSSYTTRKFFIRRNKNKVDSVETGRVVIADLLP